MKLWSFDCNGILEKIEQYLMFMEKLTQRGPMGTMGSNGSSVVSSLGKSGKSRKVGWTMPRQRSWFLLAAISKWHRRASPLSSNVVTLLHKIGEEGGKGEKEEDEEDDGAPLYKASERYGRAWLFALPVPFFPLWVSKVSGVSVTVSILARSTSFGKLGRSASDRECARSSIGNIDDSKLCVIAKFCCVWWIVYEWAWLWK